MSHPIRALIASRLWACDPARLSAWAAGRESVATLADRGLALSPVERFSRAIDGQPVIEPEVAPDGTATIAVHGVLLLNAPWWATVDGDATDYLHLRAALDQCAADVRCRSVCLAFDSPGGEACGLTETIAAIERCQAAGKPVCARISGMCGSAAYFLASACDTIHAEADALVGSIGAYALLCDSTGMQEASGLRLTLVSSGGIKGAGADGRVTDALKDEVQERIDALAAAFVAQVADGRDLEPDAARALATGAAWLAPEAKAKGLVDSVGRGAAEPAAEPEPEPAAEDEPEPVPAPAVAEPDPLTPTAARAAIAKDNVMPPTVAELAALLKSHPAHATLIAERAEAGDDAKAIAGAITAAEQAAVAQAAAEKAAATEAELARVKAELADARAKQAEADGRAKQAEAIAKLARGASDDPGPGGEADATLTCTSAEFLAMSPPRRSEFRAKGGRIVDVAPTGGATAPPAA